MIITAVLLSLKTVFHYCLCSNLPSVSNEKLFPWGNHISFCHKLVVGCNMPNKGIANFQFGIVTADSLGKCQDSLCSMLDLFKAHVTCKLLRSMLNIFFFYLMNSKVLDAAETFYFSSTSTLFLVIPLLKVACPPCHLPVISTVIGSQLYTYSIKTGTL